MHYKTINFNIKLPLNIHKFKFDIATLRHLRFFLAIFQLLPPPPNPKNGSTPLFESVNIDFIRIIFIVRIYKTVYSLIVKKTFLPSELKCTCQVEWLMTLSQLK